VDNHVWVKDDKDWRVSIQSLGSEEVGRRPKHRRKLNEAPVFQWSARLSRASFIKSRFAAYSGVLGAPMDTQNWSR